MTGTIDVSVAPDADPPTLTLVNAEGMEDHAIPLDIHLALSDKDGSEHLSGDIILTNIPDGAHLSVGEAGPDHTWVISQDDLHPTAFNSDGVPVAWEIPNLTITPPHDSDQDFNLGVSVTTQDGDEIRETQGQLAVVVDPDSDGVMFHTASKPSGGHGQGGSQGGSKDGQGGSKGGSKDGKGGSKDGKGGSKGGSKDGKGGSKGGSKDGNGTNDAHAAMDDADAKAAAADVAAKSAHSHADDLDKQAASADKDVDAAQKHLDSVEKEKHGGKNQESNADYAKHVADAQKDLDNSKKVAAKAHADADKAHHDADQADASAKTAHADADKSHQQVTDHDSAKGGSKDGHQAQGGSKGGSKDGHQAQGGSKGGSKDGHQAQGGSKGGSKDGHQAQGGSKGGSKDGHGQGGSKDGKGGSKGGSKDGHQAQGGSKGGSKDGHQAQGGSKGGSKDGHQAQGGSKGGSKDGHAQGGSKGGSQGGQQAHGGSKGGSHGGQQHTGGSVGGAGQDHGNGDDTPVAEHHVTEVQLDIGFNLGDQDGSEHLSGNIVFTNIPDGVTLSVGHPGIEPHTWEVPQENLQVTDTNAHGDAIGWNIPGLSVDVPEGVNSNFDLGIRVTTHDGTSTLTSEGGVTVDLADGVTKTVETPNAAPAADDHHVASSGASQGGHDGHDDHQVVADGHQTGGSKGGDGHQTGGSKGGSGHQTGGSKAGTGGSKGGTDDHAHANDQSDHGTDTGHEGTTDATVIHAGDGHDVLEITVAHQGNGTSADFEVQIDGHVVGGGPISADAVHNHGDWDVIRIEGVNLGQGDHTISVGSVDEGGNQVLVDKIAVNGNEFQAEDHATWDNGAANVQGGDAVHIHQGDEINFSVHTDAADGAEGSDHQVSDHMQGDHADILDGDGNELFIFGHGGGVDHVDGSATSEGWLDSIHLEDVSGGPAANLDHAQAGDWTLETNHDFTVDSNNHTIDFNSHDASGTITMEDGTKIEFHNVEHIQW